MKKYLGLVITNGAILGVYGLATLIAWMVNIIIQFRNAGVDFGIQATFQGLFILLYVAALITMAFFTYKKKLFIIPVAAFVIYQWGLSIISLISFITYPQGYSWVAIPEFLLLTAALIVSIIEFVLIKPFSRESQGAEETQTKTKEKPISFDDILKAKELLDAGAITNEEFYEIKRRALK